MSYTKEQAIEAYICVRKNNHSIPDEALDSMKAALLAFPDVLEALECVRDSTAVLNHLDSEMQQFICYVIKQAKGLDSTK